MSLFVFYIQLNDRSVERYNPCLKVYDLLMYTMLSNRIETECPNDCFDSLFQSVTVQETQSRD